MTTKDVSSYAVQYDLSNCDQEPIHIISVVQDHACLLVCREKDLSILQASSNCELKLGVPYSQVLNKYLSDILPPEAFASLATNLKLGSAYLAENPIQMNVPIHDQPNWLNCMVSLQPVEGLLILELEPLETNTLTTSYQHNIGLAIQRIQSPKQLSEILQNTVQEVKKITGYDRVMLYKFEKDGHGHVVAEAKEEHLEPFLGLHYPASDIPAQARALYLKNPVRIISDVFSQPSQIHPSVNPDTKSPFDMSHVVARGVSPIHIEYLQNMGVRATMSVAIVFEEELWGLIACHHYDSPKFTGFSKRNIVWMLGRIISGHLSLQTAKDFRRTILEANLIKSKLFEQMAANRDIVEGLTQGENTLLHLNSCNGAALYHERKLVTLGETPEEVEIHALIDWLDQEHSGSILFHTDELPRLFPPAKSYQTVAAGIMAVRLSKIDGDYILWFKPEQVKTVTWGGNPEKALNKTEEGFRLSPRKSFEKWKQKVLGTSTPWSQYEIDTALALQSDVKDFIFQKYQEVKQFNKELTEAYRDLESFSYSVSHDLRAPLRSIDGFASILKEDYGLKLDEEGNLLIDTILESATRLNLFIEDILAYSRMCNRELQFQANSLGPMIESITNNLLKVPNNKQITIDLRVTEDIPKVLADQTMLKQLLTNVIANAIKYSRNSNPIKIEVGGDQNDTHSHFFIRDNGIGFDPKHKDKIFDVFTRLVHNDEYEGTGVGLAIVKRIVEKHHGKIEVDSKPGTGTAFHFYFPHLIEH